jgi:hypothetical protein
VEKGFQMGGWRCRHERWAFCILAGRPEGSSTRAEHSGHWKCKWYLLFCQEELGLRHKVHFNLRAACLALAALSPGGSAGARSWCR